MKKIDVHGVLREYSRIFKMNSPDKWIKTWITTSSINKEPNIECDCGSKTFKICWWDYPYVGGYCRIVCPVCDTDLELIDDFA